MHVWGEVGEKKADPVGGEATRSCCLAQGLRGRAPSCRFCPGPSLARLGEEWPPAAGQPSGVSGGGTCTALSSGLKLLSHRALRVVTRVKRGPTSLALGWREGGLGQWPRTPNAHTPCPSTL